MADNDYDTIAFFLPLFFSTSSWYRDWLGFMSKDIKNQACLMALAIALQKLSSHAYFSIDLILPVVPVKFEPQDGYN